MDAKVNFIKNVAIIVLLTICPFLGFGQEPDSIKSAIPQVWSSAKRTQPITAAASTVEIITAEDIENSGHTNLGDVFRMVVGMDNDIYAESWSDRENSMRANEISPWFNKSNLPYLNLTAGYVMKQTH